MKKGATTVGKSSLAVVRLHRHLKGFSLVCDNGDPSVVAHLYGLARTSDLEALLPAERIFGRDLTMEQALREIVNRAISLGYRVSVCGDRRREPVLRIWQPQEQRPEARVQIRLPAGRWAADAAVWEQHYPGLWVRLEDAFVGPGQRVAVECTSPAGILEGRVVVRKGAADVCLTVQPLAWHATVLSQAEEDADVKWWFDGLIRFGPAGGEANGTITARRFSTLMRRLALLVDRLQGEAGAAEVVDVVAAESAGC